MMYFGILCFIYYGAIVCCLKRWNSTFSRFWLLAGTGFLFLDLIADSYKAAGSVIKMALLLCLLVFMIVEIPVIKAMFPDHEKNLSYLVVLGAKVNGKVVSDSLKRRLDQTIVYLRENPETRVIVSGGQGVDEEVSEAQAMKEYLLENGIFAERILVEANSRNTKENLRFSKQFFENEQVSVGIVTNQFHMYRACCYAKRAGYQNVKRIPAGCHPVLFLNYMVREFFAVLKLWIFR